MIRPSNQKKTAKEALPAASQGMPRRLLRRVRTHRTSSPARTDLGAARSPGPTAGDLHAKARYATAVSLLRSAAGSPLGLPETTEALVRLLARSPEDAQPLPCQRTDLSGPGQLLSTPANRSSAMGTREQDHTRLDTDERFLAQPDRVSVHRTQRLCVPQHLLPHPSRSPEGHLSVPTISEQAQLRTQTQEN